jgi:nucleotide-binding universal stress UspA family protein
MAQRAQQILAAAGNLATQEGASSETLHRSGDDNTYAVILEVASERNMELIVLGSHGRSGVSAVLLGSVTMKVLAHTTKPVLIVR